MKTQDKKQKKYFQSHLVITRKPTREAVSKFLKTLGITLPQNSPDQTIIIPEKDLLSIEEAREVRKLIFQKPIQSDYKIVAIPSAHKLSLVVQNCLLKILEEPPRHAIIILVGASTENILPTILSRVITTFLENETDQKKVDSTSYTINSLEDLASIEEPKSWIDRYLISQYEKLLKTQEQGASIKIRNSIEFAQETKRMIDANVNPKHALMSLWIKTR